MNLFSSIIDQIVSRLTGNELKIKEIKESIGQIIGFEINQDQIKIKDSVVFLNISPTVKTKILFKKQEIIKALNKFNIKDIK